jgi:small GTP-binding protein
MEHDLGGWIGSVDELMGRSPIRESATQAPRIVSEEGRRRLEQLRDDLQRLREKLAEPLRIVVMGEVKAGKSSIVNALLGVQVAPTDVLEATGWIQVIEHGEEPAYRATYEDGAEENLTPEEVAGLPGSERRVAVLHTTLPQESIRGYYLVDTPGLRTVTTEYHDKAWSYLRESDLLLWVLNGTTPGQKDVADAVRQASKAGKPIVLVVNRIDEIWDEDEVAEVVEYVEQTLGIYAEQVLKTSAGGSSPLEDGIAELREYLERKVMPRKAEVRDAAVVSSARRLLIEDLALHRELKLTMVELKELYEREKAQVAHRAGMIMQRIRLRLREEVRSIINAEEGRAIRLLQSENKLGSPVLHAHELAARIEERVVAVAGEVRKSMEQEWMAVVEDAAKSIDSGVGSLREVVQQRTESVWYYGADQVQKEMLDGALKGVAIGGATAVAWTVLSVPLAYFTTAVSVFIPPLAIGGAIVGVLYGSKMARAKKEMQQEKIQGMFDRIRESLDQFVDERILAELEECNERAAGMLTQGIARRLLGEMPVADLDALVRRVDVYESNGMEALKGLDSLFGGGKLPEPRPPQAESGFKS